MDFVFAEKNTSSVTMGHHHDSLLFLIGHTVFRTTIPSVHCGDIKLQYCWVTHFDQVHSSDGFSRHGVGIKKHLLVSLGLSLTLASKATFLTLSHKPIIFFIETASEVSSNVEHETCCTLIID